MRTNIFGNDLRSFKKGRNGRFFYKIFDFRKLQNIHFVGYKNKHGEYVNWATRGPFPPGTGGESKI
jgi:hypothetical protein